MINPRRLRSILYHPIFIFNAFALGLCLFVGIMYTWVPLATIIALMNVAIVLARDISFKRKHSKSGYNRRSTD